MLLFKWQSSTQKKNHILVIDHTWRCTFVKILLYFEYNTSNYCIISTFKKTLAKWPFLCSQNGENSPQEKPLSYIINIYFKVFNFLDKVYNNFKYLIFFLIK